MRPHLSGRLAVTALVSILSTGPAWADARESVSSGLAAFQAGDTEGAIRMLTEAINSRELSGANLATIYYDRGGMYLSKNEYAKALADADKAVALSPNYANALKMRGTINFAKGDMDAAIASLQAAEQQLPDDDGIHVDLGNAWRSKGDHAKAMAEYDKAIAMRPTPLGFAGRALNHLAAGENDAAVADFSEAIRLKPDYAAAYLNRANAYIAGGKLDLAVADFNQALKLRPGDAGALAGRAGVLARLGHADQAATEYDAMLLANPNDAMLHRKRGDVYLAARQYDKAIADYDAALALTPGDAGVLLNRGAAYHSKGNYARAIDDYTAALAATPNDARLYNNRGNAYAAMSKFDLAIADYDAALRIQPGYPDALHNRDGAMKAKTTGKAVHG